MATYITARSIVVNEIDGFADVVLTLSEAVPAGVTVTYSVTYSTAQFNDYTNGGSGSVVFGAAETSKTVRITLANDTTTEGFESLYMNLATASNGALFANNKVVISIAPNDQSPGVPLASVRDVVVDEKAGKAIFTVTLDQPSTGSQTVNYATASGTAGQGLDFNAAAGSLLFTPGQTTQSFEVSLIDDALAEGDEFFLVNLTNPSSGLQVAHGQAIGRIVASDATPVSQPVIRVENAIVDEAAGYIEFVARLSAPSAQEVRVGYGTSHTSTESGDVNTSIDGTLIFAPGETAKVVRIDIGDDFSFEVTEGFYIAWTGAVNAVIDQAYSYGVIQDNDGSAGTPLVGIRDVRVDEGAGVATFIVWMDKPASGTVSVNFATSADTAAADSDFASRSGTVTFRPGEVLTTVQVPIVNDSAGEGIERFYVTLSDLVGGTLGQSRATALIAASDGTPAATPTLSVESTEVNESQGYAEVVLRLSAPSAQQVTASLQDTYYGNHYLEYAYGYSSTVIFAPGEVEKTVRYIVYDDTEFEPAHFFRPYITSVTNAVLGRASGLVTITGNDGAPGTPLVSIDDTRVDEKAGVATLVISLDRPSLEPVSVNWTAAQGSGNAAPESDFRNSSGTVAFAPGETTRTIVVPIIDDADVEPAELFTLTLSAPVGATLGKAEGTVWIGASDAANVSTPVLNAWPAVVNEVDGSFDVMVTLSAPSAQQVSVGVRDVYSYGVADSVDYTYLSSNLILTFAPGETVKLVRYGALADTNAEGAESFAFYLNTPTNATIGNPYAAITLSRDSVMAGTPVISVLDAVTDEKAGFAAFHVVLDRPAEQLVSFNWEVTALNADVADVNLRSGTMSILPGQSTTTLLVPVIDDSTAEGDELFSLNLSNLSNAVAGQLQATGRILASDAANVSTPVISAEHTLADEYRGWVDVVIRLSAPSAQQVSVTWNDDYTGTIWQQFMWGADGVLVFAPGETSKVLRIALNDDSSVEPAQTFWVQLSAAQNAVIGNTRGTVTLVASENSAVGTPVLWASDTAVDEKSGSARFFFTLDRAATEPVSFAWSTQHINTDGADYVARSGRVVFEPGQTLASVVITLNDDATAEGDELFTLDLSDPQGLQLSNTLPVARIGASDAALTSSPVISVEATTVNETAGYVEAVVRLSAPSSQTVTVTYDDDYNGNVWEDYAYSNGGILVFAPGETLKAVRFGINGDTAEEGAESFFIRLHTPVNGVVSMPYNTVTIAPHRASETVANLRVNDVIVDEKAGVVNFVVQLSRPSTDVVSVRYATVDGTATSAGDYTASSGTLAFAPGETMKRVTVPLADDAVDEADELFFLALSDASGATIAQARGTARVGASDGVVAATPVVSVESTVVDEAAGVAEVVLRLNRPSTQQTSVAYTNSTESSTGGGDYDSSNSGIAVFAPGETLKVLRWSLTDDTADEPAEIFSVRLTTPVNLAIGSSYGFVTIAANDNATGTLPTASVQSTAVDERDGMARFVIMLDRAAAETVTIDWATLDGSATAGTDYVAQSGRVAFLPGETTRTVLVPVVDDAQSETDETFSLVLSNPYGTGLAQATGTGRIVANDQTAVSQPQIFVEPVMVNEQQGYAEVVVRLSAPSTNQVTVNYADSYTGTIWQDYAYGNSGTLVFQAGTTLRVLRYALVDDATVEANETFTVTLSAPVNATLGQASAGVTITDRDGGPTVTISDNVSGTLTTGQTVTYTLAFSEAVTGLASDDFTLINAGTIESLTGSGASYQLTVTPASGVQGQQIVTLKADAVTNTGGVGNLPASAAQTLDTLAPTVVSFSPADEATGVRNDVNVVLGFSEPVSLGSSGTLQLLRGSTVVETFNVAPASPRLTLSADGLTLTIDPTAGLFADTVYSLVIGGGAVRDALGQGIVAVSTYNFRTVVNAAPGGTVAIVGTANVGQTLSLQNALTDADGMGPFSYQWLRGGEPIAGATFSTYTLGAADVGNAVSARVSWTDGGGTLEAVTTAATAAVIGGAVLNGTTASDSLISGAAGDTINGLAGDDFIHGGAGADSIDGGEGYDVASYLGTLPVNANLGAGTVSVGDGTDVIVNIEALFGSSVADTLVGIAQATELQRGETMRGGAGNDTINGLGGVDTAEFTGPRAGYQVSRDLGSGVITVTDIDLSNGNDGTDMLLGIERLQFADQMLAFGTRAEEIARVAMALWSPVIIGSTTLFSRGYSFYDVGYTFEVMSRVALQFWPQLSDSQLAAQLIGNSGAAKTVDQLLAIAAANGGGDNGRAAMVREIANDPTMFTILNNTGVKLTGVVSDNFVPDFGTLFSPLPGSLP